jgi:hypothetical protein
MMSIPYSHFMLDKTWNAATGELSADPANRTIMSPFAAKRSAIMTAEFLKTYDAKYLTLQMT